MADITHYLTIRQVTAQTGIPRRTLVHHIHTGQLTATQLPGPTGAYMIDIDDLDRYLSQRGDFGLE